MADAPPPDSSPADMPADAAQDLPAEAAQSPPTPPIVVTERNKDELCSAIRALKDCAPKNINDEDILITREKFTIFRDKEIPGGSNSKLFLAQDPSAAQILVRICPMGKFSKRQKENFLNGSLKVIAYLIKVKPPNIINFHSVYVAPQKAYIFSEHCKGGELWKYAKEKAKTTKLTEDDIKPWIRNIAEGLQWLYLRGIGHRNLGSDAIVLTEDKIFAKIGSFGQAILTWDPNTSTPIKADKNSHFEPCYAPESMKGPYDPHAADIWGLGVIIADCLTAKHPFTKSGEKDYDTAVRNHFRKNLVSISQQLDLALKRIFEMDPTKRATPQEILSQMNWLM